MSNITQEVSKDSHTEAQPPLRMTGGQRNSPALTEQPTPTTGQCKQADDDSDGIDHVVRFNPHD